MQPHEFTPLGEGQQCYTADGLCDGTECHYSEWLDGECYLCARPQADPLHVQPTAH